jgi:hypothetical protein
MDRVQVESSGDRVTVRLPVTISLRMSVGEGDLAALRDVPSPAPQPQTAPAVVSKPAPEAALAEARRQLADRGEVVSVRLGWRFRDGWLTDERVIVVAVDEKLRESTLVAQGRESLPREIGGVAIDVRTAGPLELLARRRNLEPGEALALHEAFRAPRIRYRGPANGTQLLKPVDVTRVVAHASPEAGWDTLRTFIDGTQRDLRIAMYDFGATHIRDAVAGQAGAVRLTIQPSESLSGDTKKDDQPDAEIVQSLEGALGERFAAQWMDVSRRNGWVASSYHIKVAVRDGKATWLSSGNWQSSNQPDRAVLQLDDADLLAGYNREWHVVAEGRDLAQAFKGFLDHDFANGGAPLGEPPIEERVLVGIPADWDLEFRERRREIRLFPPAVFEGPIRTQPLLTPDNYVDHVLALIESAQRTLYFQNQSLSLIDGSDPRFLALVDALLAKQRAGLDVRIIFRDIGDVRGRLEALKDHGFDMRGVRLHPKCHTKGIVVDGERVLIGSHNWTNDGTLFNRDASLIFFHAGIARYFQDLFLYDWENWSRQRTLFEGLAVELLSPEEAKQRHGLGAEAAGRHVMTLREFYGED